MARTNISVDQAVFNEFSGEAERLNKTLFAFANESLSVIAKVASEGGNPTDLYSVWRSTSLLKQIDVITLPSDFVDELIARLYADDKVATLKMFSDLGGRLVSVLKIAADDIQDLSKLARDFGGLLPIKQLTLKAHAAKGELEVDVVGAGRRLESTECAREFLVSIVRGYGYAVARQEVNVGTIRLWLTPRNQQ
jgi:hypothetical protein